MNTAYYIEMLTVNIFIELHDKIVIIFRLQPRGSITFVYKIDKYGVL